MKTDNLISLLKAKKEEIFNSFELEGLGVFGSYAKKGQQHASDIDILVFPKKDSLFTYKKRLGLESFVKRLLEIEKIDIVNNRYINPVIKKEAQDNILYI